MAYIGRMDKKEAHQAMKAGQKPAGITPNYNIAMKKKTQLFTRAFIVSMVINVVLIGVLINSFGI